MLNDNKIFPKDFSKENFFYFLNDNAFQFLRVIEHFMKDEDISGIKKDLFCGGGDLDLKDDFHDFDITNKAEIKDISFTLYDSDYNEILRVINKKAPNIGAMLNKRVTGFILSKHAWLLLEIKAKTFSDSFARDGFLEWLFIELTGNDIPCPLRNPDDYTKALSNLERKIKTEFSIMQLV
jgi:hypothetical protein